MPTTTRSQLTKGPTLVNSKKSFFEKYDVIKGTKRNADGRAVLGDVTNKSNLLRKQQSKGLKQRSSNLTTSKKKVISATSSSSSSKKENTKENNLPVEVNTVGNTDFMIVPLKTWQYEIREKMRQSPEGFYDQEEKTKNNHFESSDFSLGIFEYMKWREEKFEMLPYFENSFQSGFTEFDRKTLIDWMVEFQEIQETTHETLYLAVRICDYFFSRVKVTRDKLQLYAFTSFLIAAKFEERWPPTFEDMIYLSEDSYKREDFITAELQMLKTLDFDLNIPISYRYLRRYSKCIGMDMRALTTSRFYLELTLLEYEYINEKQSMLAAACLWISLVVLGYDSKNRCDSGSVNHRERYWSNLLSFYTGYNEWEIIALAVRVAKTVLQTQKDCKHIKVEDEENSPQPEDDRLCTVVYKKYSSRTFFQVAQFSLPSLTDLQYHVNRCETERIDFECQKEPNVKRRSSGCVSKLQQMKLRSSISPNPPKK